MGDPRPPDWTEAEREVFAALLASPHDPGPRAVLADLWMEQGVAHGELLRLTDEETSRRRARIDKLVRTDALRRFLGPMAGIIRRGRLCGGLLDFVDLSGRHPELLDAAADDPRWSTVQHLELPAGPAQRLRDWVFTHPGWSWLTSARFRRSLDLEEAVRRGWTFHRSLDLAYADRAQIQGLADPAVWPNLEDLSLYRHPPGDDGLKTLMDRPLERLTLPMPQARLEDRLFQLGRGRIRQVRFRQADFDLTVEPASWAWTVESRRRFASPAEVRERLNRLPKTLRQSIEVYDIAPPREPGVRTFTL